MTKRSLALIVASFSLITAVTTREARASQCGDSPEIAAQNVKLNPSPIDSCIKPSVSGTNRPGCAQLDLDIQNDCTDPVYVATEEGAICPPADESQTCLTIAPGESGQVWLQGDAAGPLSRQFAILHGGQTTTLYVTADLIDVSESSGCSVGPVGARGAPGAWMGMAGIGLALSVLRLRRRK